MRRRTRVCNGGSLNTRLVVWCWYSGAGWAALCGGTLKRGPNSTCLSELKVLLPGFAPPPMPVSVLYAQNRQLSSRVRVFTQWLRDIFEAAEAA